MKSLIFNTKDVLAWKEGSKKLHFVKMRKQPEPDTDCPYHVGVGKDRKEVMDIQKIRAFAPLLPPPGDEVVLECLTEIERLREALTEIASGNRTAHECVNWARLALSV